MTGIIRELIVKEGETVPTGAPIAIIDDVAADAVPAPNGSASPSEQVAAAAAPPPPSEPAGQRRARPRRQRRRRRTVLQRVRRRAARRPTAVQLAGPGGVRTHRRCAGSRANTGSTWHACAAPATTAASPPTTSSRPRKRVRAQASPRRSRRTGCRRPPPAAVRPAAARRRPNRVRYGAARRTYSAHAGAQDHRAAHGRIEAHRAARLDDGRSRRHQRLEVALAREGRVRARERRQADAAALLHPRGRRIARKLPADELAVSPTKASKSTATCNVGIAIAADGELRSCR